VSPPTAAGQLRVARLTDRLQLAAPRHVEALRSLAAGYWRYMRHPGWALAPDALVSCFADMCYWVVLRMLDALQTLIDNGDAGVQ
jgi:hypothetical protein